MEVLINFIYYLIGFILGWFLHSYIHWYINSKKCCANCQNFEHKGYGMGFCHKYSNGNEKHFHTDKCFAFNEKKEETTEVKKETCDKCLLKNSCEKAKNNVRCNLYTELLEASGVDCNSCHYSKYCIDKPKEKCERYSLERLCSNCINYKLPLCPKFPNSGIANYCDSYFHYNRTIYDYASLNKK